MLDDAHIILQEVGNIGTERAFFLKEATNLEIMDCKLPCRSC